MVLRDVKYVDIVQELRKLEFRPFAKIVKARAARQTAPNFEEDKIEAVQREEAQTDSDYLLQMAFSSLTKEKVGL